MRKLILFVIFALIMLYPSLYWFSSEEVTITIKDKERVVTGSGEEMSSKYLIYSETEVFENTDSWLYFKFNSSDVYGGLQYEKTYTVKVAGWRSPFLSMYRNIISIEEAQK